MYFFSFLLSHVISNKPLSRIPSHTPGKEKKYTPVFPLKDKYKGSLQVTAPEPFLRLMNRKHLLTEGRLRETDEIHLQFHLSGEF